ncbi:hypothetical protein [Sediminibacterium sp.]|uniref:hypothetical protein n=1 Tax=Sediminibacterium sp. TaxID=1917865 RepID=UPI0025E98CD4|nr:hypothetical protein [Sediminibacterium sp.]
MSTVKNHEINKQIKLIKEIGRKLFCTEEDFKTILLNYPTLRGSEFIFTIGDGNAYRYIDSEVDSFVKGLHVIEMLYKHKMSDNFGFGSPSPTYKIIRELSKSDESHAEELRKWIYDNGGNYYIKS